MKSVKIVQFRFSVLVW